MKVLIRQAVFVFLLPTVPRAAQQTNLYWGDMHGHTAHSDGKGSLDDYFTHARDVAKLDFVVVSDHDFSNLAPWQIPQETTSIATRRRPGRVRFECGESDVRQGRLPLLIVGQQWSQRPSVVPTGRGHS